MVITGSSGGCDIYTDDYHEITLDNVTGYINLDLSSSMTIKLKGENRLNHIHCDGDVTINDAGDGDGTLIVINSGTPLSGNFIIEGGTVKAKATNMGPALSGDLTVNGGAVYLKGVYNEDFQMGFPAIKENLTVNDGDVYLAGGDGAPAVGGEIDGEAEWYGRNDVLWMLSWNYSQYITTDVNPDHPYIPDPTDPGNSKWNW